MEHTYAVILAGGTGTRLWPKSKTNTPKQFLKILGNETMIQMTASRIIKLLPWERIIVVSNEKYKNEVSKQLPKVPKENIISEPIKRDTALAMLVGSLFAKSKDPDAVIINLASDHAVLNVEEFTKVMKLASQTASKNDYLVTVGISPSRPSTGFGYIKIGQSLKKLDKNITLFEVENFTEKPNEETAKKFIATQKYFWNANMYVWSVATLESAFKKFMPNMFKLTKNLSKMDPSQFHSSLDSVYNQAESISIDYAISEKASNLVLIPGNFGWDDVGDWKVVYDLEKKDSDGNVIIGDGNKKIMTIDSTNNLVHTNNRLISLLGVEDFVIIDTNEVLMIMPKSKSQDIKKMIEKLQKNNLEEYL